MSNYVNDMDRAQQSPYRVAGRRKVALRGLPKPTLTHPELELVYQLDAEATSAGQVATWLALPRATLIADARAILRDGLERYDEIAETDYSPETRSFPIHALNILAALNATEALVEMLDYFRMEEDFLEFWFGDIPDQLIEPALFQLARNTPETIFAYLREPDLHYYNRVWPTHVIGHIWNYSPARRPTIEAAYLDLLDYFLGKPTPGTLDAELNSSLLVELTCIGVPGALPRIKQLFDRGLAFGHMNGDFVDVKRMYGEGFKDYEVPRLPRQPHEWWTRETRRYPAPSSAKIDSSPIAFQRAPMLVAPPPAIQTGGIGRRFAKKVGRNAPCPCGSGLKYKKCCL